jgi:hypothetical protein
MHSGSNGSSVRGTVPDIAACFLPIIQTNGRAGEESHVFNFVMRELQDICMNCANCKILAGMATIYGHPTRFLESSWIIARCESRCDTEILVEILEDCRASGASNPSDAPPTSTRWRV